ncbi:MAG: glycosyltransferase family 4 protein [Burkholderiaceae bacterium]|nr:glycosyltransferase family 4 protein [Burkholderiaceae bacterium]
MAASAASGGTAAGKGAHRILVIGSLAESLVNFRGDLLRELKSLGHDVIAAAPAGPSWVDESLARWGVRRVVLPLSRTGTNPLSDLVLLRALRRLMQAERPDALLAYTAKPVIYGLLAAAATGVPRAVALISGLGFAFLPARSVVQSLLQRITRGLYRRALRHADVVLFQNADDEQVFRDLGLLRPGVSVRRVAGSGVNLERYARQPLPPGPPRFLLIARLLIDKGVGEYLDAAARLHAEGAGVRCELVGPLEAHPAAIDAARIERDVAAGTIAWHGAVRDVRPHLAACHVYVLPSYREGTPRTVLEAMAVGRPVITTDAPGCRETVVPGVNGTRVPVADSNALYREMKRFAALPRAELERMADASRAIATAEFDVRKVNAAVIAALVDA